MRISRRTLLLNLGIRTPAIVAFSSTAFAESSFKSFQLLLSDITPTTPSDALLAVLAPFVEARVPICCIVSAENDTGAFRPDSDLAGVLRRMISDYSAQIEVALEVPKLTDQPYYFQSRLATQVRRTLEEGLSNAQSNDKDVRSVLTLASYGTAFQFNPGGVRAAGFRTVLSLPRSGIMPMDSRWIDGTLHLFGGMHFGLTERFETIQEALTASVRDDPRALLILSVAGLTPENVTANVERMTQIGSLVSGLAGAGQIVPTTPTDFHFRSSAGTNTVIGLRLDVPGKPDEPVSATALELAQWLRTQEIAFTVAGPVAHLWIEEGSDVCPTDGHGLIDDQNRCRMMGYVDLDQPDIASPPPQIAMTVAPIIDPVAGVDNNATLHPPRIAFVDDMKSARQNVSDFKALADTVLVLDHKSHVTVAQKTKAMAIIGMLDERGGFEVTDVASLADQIQTPDSIQRVHHQTKDVMHRERAALAANEQLDHDLVRNDAELAWRYFRNLTNPETGLLASTAFLARGKTTLYNYATMWDVGSQIFGMIAAVELDLMELTELNSWAERLIASLPTVVLQGLRLPSSIFHAGNNEAPDQSFTTCDAGRLLSALHRLRTFSPALKDIIESKVDSWDLQSTIHDGRMQDLTVNRTIDRFISHCTGYSARAYGAFGVTADSPYAELDGHHDADAMIKLLYSASTIGSIGAEPLLLEGVEVGFSQTSQYLADMLFAAQIEDNRETGTMRCVSECPLDQAPWFTYQGYSINNFAKPWNVQVRSYDERYASPEFLKSIEVVSVKAAFLWATTHPHSYSSELVNYVRARARIEGFGFSPGIYQETGLAMADYSDLNTNGIILEAAAAILNA
ncbi:MAG: hypothetical protein ACJAWC_003067 [Yoonia sp.]|jgi:hypothetical protein